MSHVAEVQTEFKDGPALKKACQDVFGQVAEGAAYKAYYAHQNRPRVDFVIGRAQAKTSADVGFVKGADGKYSVLADNMDETRLRDRLSKLKQRYSYHVTVAAAKRQGYTVSEKADVKTGAIKLTLAKY